MRLMLGGLTEPQARDLFDATADIADSAGILHDWTMMERACSEKRPDVVAIYLGMRPAQVLQMITRVRALNPSITFLAITDHASGPLVQQVTEAGCADLVVLRECPDDLRRALRTLETRDRPPTADGQAVAVMGAKGGMGTTTVAVNLADALAQRNEERVILVDLNVYMGDVAVSLDLRPRPSAIWFLLRGQVVDGRTWAEAPPLHSGGFRVLGLDGDVSTVMPVSAEQVVFLVERLKERYEHVILDVGSDVGEVSLAACTAADQRLLVFTDELAARTGAKRRLGVLRQLDLGPSVAKGVLNRGDPDDEDLLHALEKELGMPVPSAITNSWKDVQAAYERGRTLRQTAPRSRITRDLRELVKVVAGEAHQTAKRKRAFFGFFR
jgi:pilus assembly protein CpaE